VDEWQTVTRNYLVTYRYDGREYTTVMPNDPGRNIRVRVAIAPDYDERVSYLAPEHRDNGWHRGWDKRRGRD
jgi:hypothetical protein